MDKTQLAKKRMNIKFDGWKRKIFDRWANIVE